MVSAEAGTRSRDNITFGPIATLVDCRMHPAFSPSHKTCRTEYLPNEDTAGNSIWSFRYGHGDYIRDPQMELKALGTLFTAMQLARLVSHLEVGVHRRVAEIVALIFFLPSLSTPL